MKLHETVPSFANFSQGASTSAVAEVGDMVHLSGLVNLDLEAGTVPDAGIEEAAPGVLKVVESVLGDLDLTMDHVLKIVVYLESPECYPAWEAAFTEAFTAPRPLRTTVIASVLGGPIEVDVTACRTPRSGS